MRRFFIRPKPCRLPIVLRGELNAIVLFGPRVGGEQLDPEELAVFGRSFKSAKYAFDDLEARSAMMRADALQVVDPALRSLLVARNA